MKHVESLFFGDHDNLFGMYHPATGVARNHGVVVCAPLFHEYYRSHFTLKRIALELAAKGYDVLRFDYSGIGDSKGNVPQDPFAAWTADIGEAMAEIRRLSGCTSVSLVTTRYGTALALPWQAKTSRFVCWDPVLDHDLYTEQVDEMNDATLSEHRQMSGEDKAKCTEEDYLGVGISRDAFRKTLARFASQLDAEGLRTLPERGIALESDSPWQAPHLEMTLAHDVVREVVDAM